MLFIHAVILLVTLVFNKKIKSELVSYTNCEAIEILAEEYPYVITVLNHAKDYVCTGIIINKRTVLTSGRCINLDPLYIAVGTAVFSKSQNNNSIFEVAFSKLHPDYIFHIQEIDFSISQMHSNIGLIFTVRPLLDAFLESAKLGNYFASELKGKELLLVGYGTMKSSKTVVLQRQMYYQIPCKNPKWYYCVCGIERLSLTYEETFGEGAPVLYNGVVVGVAASPSGSLTLNRNIGYNIFTVIGPYLPWIEKSKSYSILEFKASSNGVWQANRFSKCFILIVNILIVSNK